MRLYVLVARITLFSLNFASIKFRNFERKLELECTKFCDFFLIFNMKVAIATDFGTISKESLKRMTKWGAKYFTHPSPYHPFKDVRFMTPLPPDELSKGEEQAMKDWIQNYRSVRQRTARSETTKDKQEVFLPQCIQMQILMPLQGSFFQLTKLNKRPLPPLRCALLFPMCPC